MTEVTSFSCCGTPLPAHLIEAAKYLVFCRTCIRRKRIVECKRCGVVMFKSYKDLSRTEITDIAQPCSVCRSVGTKIGLKRGRPAVSEAVKRERAAARTRKWRGTVGKSPEAPEAPGEPECRGTGREACTDLIVTEPPPALEVSPRKDVLPEARSEGVSVTARPPGRPPKYRTAQEATRERVRRYRKTLRAA